jgi:Xaa-Pro aminopeptidase
MDNPARSAACVNWPVLHRKMDGQRLDALVAATPEGTFYLTGMHVELNRWFRDRLALVVVPRTGTPTFIVCNIEERLTRSIAWVDDIRTYVHYVESVGALTQVLEEKGLSQARIGFEERFWSTEFYRRVAESLPKATFVGADAVIDETRTLKMPAEVARLQEAARLSDEAAHAAWTQSRSGTTEHDLAIAMTQEILARGAQSVAQLFLGSGPNTQMIRHRPGGRTLARGDLVVGEFGVVHKGYWSDLCRMGVVGEPSTRQHQLYKVLRDVQRDVISQMKPGVRCNELYALARDAYLKAGADAVLPDIGHSMARARGQEPPVLHELDSTPLEANMVFAVGPSFTAGSEHYQLKDLVGVTESEPTILSDQWDTRELFVFT